MTTEMHRCQYWLHIGYDWLHTNWFIPSNISFYSIPFRFDYSDKKRILRVSALLNEMVEVYISGTIESAQGFPDNRLFCRWNLQIGGGWRVVEGSSEGQTQTDNPEIFEKAYFSHPIDIHLATKSIQGWPRIHLQVWHHDAYGRQELYGYGTVFVPSNPGEHNVKCHIWRPKGGIRDEMMQKFVGGGLQISNPKILEDFSERMKIESVAMGTVNMKFYLITRHFDRFGIVA